jgi:hypothetical protein
LGSHDPSERAQFGPEKPAAQVQTRLPAASIEQAPPFRQDVAVHTSVFFGELQPPIPKARPTSVAEMARLRASDIRFLCG